jgi:2-oxoglutarate/2-oxoacid ferredoxin oxidoreductase subunit beta
VRRGRPAGAAAIAAREAVPATALVEDDEQAPREDFKLPAVRAHSTEEIRRHLRFTHTVWCAGCTNGIATRAIIDALLSLAVDADKVAIVSGIGCSGRITTYLDYSTVHCTHGRALVVATGAKVADPSLTVLVVMGDGDCAAIGGNHLIHAARRNVDLTALVFNNAIYGMTGGQFGPTTPEGDVSKTSPFGNPEPAFDICALSAAAGATYVARGTPYAYLKLVGLIAGAIVHRGFSLVEVPSECPTYYGRMNADPDPATMLKTQRERAVPLERYDTSTSGGDAYPVGVLHHVERPEYLVAYERVWRRARGEA